MPSILTVDPRSVRIEHGETDTKGRYTYGEPEREPAELTYSKLGETSIIIDHTGVPDAYRGEGVGVLLVARAVEDARTSGKTILPLCPFAAAQFKCHAEWADVLRK